MVHLAIGLNFRDYNTAMPALTVAPLRSRQDRRTFLTFSWTIFRNDPLWVPPLLPDWRERIDPSRGVFFKRGTAEFFLARRGNQVVGTICAAEDRQANAERGRKECVFGFFHFLEDYPVFEALLGAASDWARQRGLDALTGPFNLDYEDGYGVLVEGRDRPPALLCGHTPAYYRVFYERYGFQAVRGDNIAYALDLCEDNPALREVSRVAGRLRERGHFVVRSADLDRWDAEIDRVHELLNLALAHLPDFRSWPREVVQSSLAPFRKIVDPALILFAETEGKSIGWLPGIPNLNEAFIHANGLRYPWDILSLLWWMRRRPACLAVKSVLVRPEYWGSGVAVLLFDEMVRRARERGYRWIDASLTSEDNPRTPALAQRFGAKLYKRYRVYRKEI
jgi:GNAT superfamily N-acetyltransferase